MINLYSMRPKGFNIGNDVIYLAVTHFLRSAIKEENINIISLAATSKYESQKKAGITPQTVYEINQFGHGLVIGGGNLYENGELEVNATALTALEVPSMIFSVSRGKIYNRHYELVDRTNVMTDEKIRALSQKVDISLSRDIATQEYIQSLGEETITGGCPTLFLNEIPQHLVPTTDAIKTDALISVRTPSLMSIPVVDQYKVREDILKIIELLKSKGYKNIKLLCHDHRDIPFAASFAGLDYMYTEDVYVYLTYLRNTRMHITYRLHSFLPCLAYDIPAIKISYDQRALSMLETVGMQSWNINMLNDDLITEIKKRIDNIGELEELKKNLKKTKWMELHETIVSSCNRFARMVLEEKSK